MPADLPPTGRTDGERYQAVLAYDGAGFEGFEAQPKRRTVQGEVETALRKIGWSDRRILAGGRTDSGVHAAGQVIAFDLEWRHGNHALQAALNAGLPPDVAVRKLAVASKDFHPRYDAVRRCYRYAVRIDEWPDPLQECQALRVWPDVRLDRMQEAAALLVGPHDFGAFGTAPREGGHTRRRVDRAEWIATGEGRLEFWLEADAFLYRMVRIVVGTLLQVGSGRRGIEDGFQPLLREPITGKAGPAAPARGLCLMQIEYPGG